MTAAQSSKAAKPAKPYPEYPLFAHNNGQWCRKIRGKIHSFGVWGDPTAALERHNKEYPYLKSGLAVPDSFDGVTVQELCNKFLVVKESELDAGEITERWFNDLHGIAKLIVAHIDKKRPVESLGPDDFRKLRQVIVKKHSPTIARNKISRIKAYFLFAYNNHLIDRPVKYGDSFKPPARAAVRKHRAKQVKKVWTPKQVRQILKLANVQFEGICLLMMNCGLASADIRQAPRKAVDLKTGWLDYPREKSGIERRGKLWPETVKALTKWMESRDDESDLLFVTRWGNAWKSDALINELAKITRKLEFDHGSPEWFRKTFQTVSEETDQPDFVAISRVMGHADGSMSDHYRQRVTDKRLEKVAKDVRKWLFGKAVAK